MVWLMTQILKIHVKGIREREKENAIENIHPVGVKVGLQKKDRVKKHYTLAGRVQRI